MDTQSNPTIDRIEHLIALTERLTTLVADQAQAFEARRPHEAALNMEETSRLANLYRQEAQRARGEGKPFADAPLVLRAKLVRATEAFDAVIARQGRALGAAMKVTEGLVHAIAEEVANQRSAQSGYGPGGVKPRRDTATSVTLNRRA
jgi:hypothetical protein